MMSSARSRRPGTTVETTPAFGHDAGDSARSGPARFGRYGLRVHGALRVAGLALVTALVSASACDGAEEGTEKDAVVATSAPAEVGYDLRLIRPRQEELLKDSFDAAVAEARAEGKRVAVLFSADWCERCQRLDAELGNLHPADEIGDVRIFMLKEEHWDQKSRLAEFNDLRRRWEPRLGTYPMFMLLDENGAASEEMKDAIDRLQSEGVEPTLANWFARSRVSGS